MKLRYKITGLVLSIAMLLSVFTPLTVSAEEPEKAPVTEEEPRELTLEDLLAGAATVEEVYGELERETVPEIVGYEAAKKAMHVRRLYADEGENLNKVVFLNADLTKTVYLFDHPVKFVDEKGMIQDITLKIKEDLSSNTLMTAKASAVTSFSKNSVDGIGLRESGVSLSLVPILPEKSASSLSRSNTRARLVDQKKVVYSYDTKTELEYALTYTGFKEEIVVKEYTGQTRYDFTLHTNGLKVVEKNGSFSLADSAGKIRALLGDIIVFTADEKNNTMGEMTATPVVENQEYLISIFVDAAFLSDPKTAYPIRIDPTVEICYDNNGAGAIQDITLNSLQGSDGSSGSLFVGKRDTYGISRFLMKFPGLNFSSLGDNVTITQATVYIRDLLPDNNAMPLNCHVFTGYVWYENTASWSNVSPNSYLASPVSSHTISSYMGQQQAEWYYFGFDITSVVAGWKSGAYAQEKGLIFKAADSVENGSTLVHKTFGSYNRSSYKPSLTVTYSSGSNLISDGTYYLNNTYSGKYLRYAPGLGLSGQSGLIADLGDTIRWEMIAVEEGNKYAIRSKSDSTKYLCVPETTSSSSVNVLTVSNYTLPSRCLWYATGSGVGGVMLRSVYNSRYLSHNGSALSTSAYAGASGTDLIRQTSWRIASISYYGNTSTNAKREMSSLTTISNVENNINTNVVITVNSFYDELWNTPTDFHYSFSNEGIVSVSNSMICLVQYGGTKVEATHKVTNRVISFYVLVGFSTTTSSTPLAQHIVDGLNEPYDVWPASEESRYYSYSTLDRSEALTSLYNSALITLVGGWASQNLDAASMLGHFLNNEGSSYDVEMKQMLSEWDTARGFRERDMDYVMKAVEASASYSNKTFRTITSLGCEVEEGTNWGRAVGSYTTNVVCTYKKMSATSYTMQVTYELHDVYDWNRETTSMGNLPVSPRDMWELHHGGMAKNYEVYGVNTFTLSWVEGQTFGEGATLSNET